MSVGLKELAAALGLSLTTVSRALNGFPEVGSATRARVLEAAQRAGYRPNATARRLATGRANAFGIVFSTGRNVLDSPIVMDFLAGVGDKAAGEGIDIVLSPTRPEDELAACQRLIAGGSVDALILFAPLLDEAGARGVLDLGFPIVVHGRPAGDFPVASLSIDNRGAFRMATRHLLDFGHRRIGLLNGDERQTYARDRREGFLEAGLAAGLGAADAPVASGSQTFQYGYEAAQAMLRGTRRPTGLVCTSILVALGAAKAAGEAGLAVPADLSLIAHDDEVAVLPPEMASPALTTVHSPIRAAGARVAQMALDRIAGRSGSGTAEVWAASLTVRGSTAAPPVRE